MSLRETKFTQRLYTVPQFCEQNPAFTVGGIRHLIFYSQPRKNSRGETVPGNGFAVAFPKIGNRVYVDGPKFFEIVDQLNQRVA